MSFEEKLTSVEHFEEMMGENHFSTHFRGKTVISFTEVEG